MASATKSLSQTRLKPVRIPVLLIFLPRIDLIISAIIAIAGLVLPLLMVIGLISFNFWLGLLSFGLIGAGGGLFIIFSGEIR